MTPFRELIEAKAVFVAPVRPNLLRRARHESGLSPRQFRKLAKRRKRAAREGA